MMSGVDEHEVVPLLFRQRAEERMWERRVVISWKAEASERNWSTAADSSWLGPGSHHWGTLMPAFIRR